MDWQWRFPTQQNFVTHILSVSGVCGNWLTESLTQPFPGYISLGHLLLIPAYPMEKGTQWENLLYLTSESQTDTTDDHPRWFQLCWQQRKTRSDEIGFLPWLHLRLVAWLEIPPDEHSEWYFPPIWPLGWDYAQTVSCHTDIGRRWPRLTIRQPWKRFSAETFQQQSIRAVNT